MKLKEGDRVRMVTNHVAGTGITGIKDRIGTVKVPAVDGSDSIYVLMDGDDMGWYFEAADFVRLSDCFEYDDVINSCEVYEKVLEASKSA